MAALSVAVLAGADAAQAAPAAPASSAGVCYVDTVNGTKYKAGTPVCDTAAVHNASTRSGFFLAATLVFIIVYIVVQSSRRDAATRAVFARDAAALRARAEGASDVEERWALEAEAADVDAAAGDWGQLRQDENILNPTYHHRGGGGGEPVNAVKLPGAYQQLTDKERKARAADERTALLQRHGEHVFDDARETVDAPLAFWRDGLFIAVPVTLLLAWLTYYEAVTPCDAPLTQICLRKSMPTYACAFAVGSNTTCVATPL